jgi:hypothetical protein
MQLVNLQEYPLAEFWDGLCLAGPGASHPGLWKTEFIMKKH